MITLTPTILTDFLRFHIKGVLEHLRENVYVDFNSETEHSLTYEIMDDHHKQASGLSWREFGVAQTNNKMKTTPFGWSAHLMVLSVTRLITIITFPQGETWVWDRVETDLKEWRTNARWSSMKDLVVLVDREYTAVGKKVMDLGGDIMSSAMKGVVSVATPGPSTRLRIQLKA